MGLRLYVVEAAGQERSQAHMARFSVPHESRSAHTVACLVAAQQLTGQCNLTLLVVTNPPCNKSSHKNPATRHFFSARKKMPHSRIPVGGFLTRWVSGVVLPMVPPSFSFHRSPFLQRNAERGCGTVPACQSGPVYWAFGGLGSEMPANVCLWYQKAGLGA